MMTCVSERSGSASIGVDRTAHSPAPTRARTPITTRKRMWTDQRMRAAIIDRPPSRSEEHTSELQSLMRTLYAAICLKNKTQPKLLYLITTITKQDNNTLL